jgi:hypothetical protein
MLDFGFAFWVLFFVVFFGCGRMCGWGARRYRRRRRDLDAGEPPREDRLSRLESRVRRREEERRLGSAPMARRRDGAEHQPVSVKRSRKTPLQELQEKFVEGRLTLSEYERELDRLERIE